MRSSNQAEIQRAFTQQADGFESDRMHFSRKAYLDDLAEKIGVSGEDAVLEVAAGTCACGRAIAPSAGRVVCLDMTPAMLSVGKAEAEKAGLGNMTFVLGDAAGLPFLDDSFDIVLSRLAFHHFPEVEGPFAEMVRVLRPGGRLALIDMEAAEAPLRETEDGIERERDPSHVRNLSRDEMLALFEKHGLAVERREAARVPVSLENWLALTKTPADTGRRITSRMEDEIRGGEKTGFRPYFQGTELRFEQRWVMIVGRKGEPADEAGR